jgi:hypothetical protein
MTETLTVRGWEADLFHRRVLEMTAQGYTVIRESYQITPEMHPETGEIIHLHQIDLERRQGHPDEPDEGGASAVVTRHKGA